MKDFNKLEKRVARALVRAITVAAEDPLDPTSEAFEICEGTLQPDVITRAAAAAAAVLIEFNRGYDRNTLHRVQSLMANPDAKP